MKNKAGLLTIVLLFSIPLSAHAFFNSDVKKAKDFMQADMYPQAIELLNKRINDKPTDADAHYLLGTCYLRQGNLGKADQRFVSAVKLDSKYRSKVAKNFQQAGNESLNKGKFSRAQQLYSKAIHNNPALQTQIAQMCFERGKASMSKPHFDITIAIDPALSGKIAKIYFDRGASSMNKSHFDMAVNINPSYKMQIYNLIMDSADVASDDDCLKLYKMAIGFRGKEDKRGKEAGRRLELIANVIQKQNAFDRRIKPILKLAKKFNENVRAYVTTLSRGDHAVVPGGNLDGQWLVTVPGKIDFYPTAGAEYNVVLRDGNKYFMGRNLPKEINQPFMMELINKKSMVIGIQ